jgi:hypothetical protein
MWEQTTLGFVNDGPPRTPPWLAWVSVAVVTTHGDYSVMTAAFAGAAARTGLLRLLRRGFWSLRRHFRYPRRDEQLALDRYLTRTQRW